MYRCCAGERESRPGSIEAHRRNSSLLTIRWREEDSNPRSPPPGGVPIDLSRPPFFLAYPATVRIPLGCPTRSVGNRLRVCLDGGKAARKGPRIPPPLPTSQSQ